MNAVDQFLLASYADSSQHRTSHLAELILDEMQPRTVGRREHEDESLRPGVQIAPVSYEICVQLFQKGDEIGALVAVAHGFDDGSVCRFKPAHSDTVPSR